MERRVSLESCDGLPVNQLRREEIQTAILSRPKPCPDTWWLFPECVGDEGEEVFVVAVFCHHDIPLAREVFFQPR
jgi:hypothetical protein